MLDVTASIVLYRNLPHIVANTIDSFLNSPARVKLVLIDNSPTDELRALGNRENCTYIFNNANNGFGKGHNKALESVAGQARYHLVLNPDVVFEKNVIGALTEFMDRNPEIGLVMPRVLNLESEIQYLAHRLPAPLDLVIRRLRIGIFTKLFCTRMQFYEMRDKDYASTFEAPSLSGCFMFFRSEVFQKTGGFDERYFMYMEDIDISRRVHRYYKTVYYPEVCIHHGHARESYQWNRLMLIHVYSAIRYFNKWGWFVDEERNTFNSGRK